MTAWWEDPAQVWEFGCWLYRRQRLYYGPDMLAYFENPRQWLKSRLEGDLRVEYEAEQEES
jgi:hypothetical protein